MGFLYENITFTSAFSLLLFIVTFLILNEISRRSKTMSLLFFCVLPLVLAFAVGNGYLGSPTGKTWFGWVKVVSALAGVYGFMLIRFTKLGQSKFAMVFPASILSLNIAEAVYRELQVFMTYQTLTVDAGGSEILGGPWNILNAIAGILTIITLSGFVGVRVSNDKSRDMIWPDMTWLYIIGYTIWNFTYVYNCISTRSMYAGFGILLAAMIAEFVFKRGAWLQHRAQILSLYAMFSLSLDFQASTAFQIFPIYDAPRLMTLSIISLVVNVVVFAYMLYTMKIRQKNPLRHELYTHTNAYQKTLLSNQLSL